MNKVVIPLALAIGFAWMVHSLPAAAQEGNARIAVIDVQRIYRESVSSKALQSELDARRKTIEAELRQREQALRQADRDLRQARGSLSEAEFQTKSHDLAQAASDLESDARESGRALDRLSKEGYAKIRAALVTVVGRIAEARGLDIVLTSSAMVLQNPALDLTEEALARLNATFPAPSPTQQLQ